MKPNLNTAAAVTVGKPSTKAPNNSDNTNDTPIGLKLPSVTFLHRNSLKPSLPFSLPLTVEHPPVPKRNPQSQMDKLKSTTALLEYPFEKLVEATDNFSKNRFLGQGTFGSVYSGSLYGTDVAVKVLFSARQTGFEEEIAALSKFRHPNLVILMGFSRFKNYRYLVFEFLSRRDLQKCLSDGSLSWVQRLKVAIDTATAIAYLHNATPKCFHRDLKAANILISSEGVAKVADFGLACLTNNNEITVSLERAGGTIGYADPEYIRSGVMNEASELYSFGVVLLELLTNYPPALRTRDGHISFLVSYTEFKVEKVMHMLDPVAKFPPNISQKLAMLSFKCLDPKLSKSLTFNGIASDLRFILNAEDYLFTPTPLMSDAKLKKLRTEMRDLFISSGADNGISSAQKKIGYSVLDAKFNSISTAAKFGTALSYNESSHVEFKENGGCRYPMPEATSTGSPLHDVAHSELNVKMRNSVSFRRRSVENALEQTGKHLGSEVIDAKSLINLRRNIGLTTGVKSINPYKSRFKKDGTSFSALPSSPYSATLNAFSHESYERLFSEFAERMKLEREKADLQRKLEEEREIHAALTASKKERYRRFLLNSGSFK